MKKILILTAAAISILFVSGCATNFPVGIIYTNVKLPVMATMNKGKPTKSGTSECQSFVGMIATGDSSIDRAVRDGNISEVQYIDWKAHSILGFIGTYNTMVKGN